MTFVEWYKELILLLFGLIGFTVVNLLFSLIFNFVTKENEVQGLTLINTCSYLLFFIFVILMLFPYYKDILHKFIKPEAYLWGFVGSVVLIGVSISYNLIIYALRPDTGTGGNQAAVIELVKNYLVISIIVIGIIGPLCEEVAYRVGLFSLFHRMHPAVAYIVTAVVFGLIHFDFTSQRQPVPRTENVKAQVWQPEYKDYPYLYNISNDEARNFYEKAQLDNIKPAFEVKPTSYPLIMQCRHCIRYSLGYCVKRGGERPTWSEPLTLILGDGRRFRLEFKCSECQMNIYAD